MVQQKTRGQILLSIPRLIDLADLPVAEGSVNERSGHESRKMGGLRWCCQRLITNYFNYLKSPELHQIYNVNSSTGNSRLFPTAHFYIQNLSSCFQVVFSVMLLFPVFIWITIAIGTACARVIMMITHDGISRSSTRHRPSQHSLFPSFQR